MEIKTRKQASIDGDNIFYTGKPCVNGHLTYRYVQSGSCRDCVNETRSVNFYKTKADTLRNKAHDALKEAERFDKLAAELDAKNKINSANISATIENLKLYNAVKNEFVIFWEAVTRGDEQKATDILLRYARIRSPLIVESDVLHEVKARPGNVRRMATHGDDLQAVRSELIALRKSHGNVDLSIISERLGVTPITVNNQISELGIKCPPSHLDLLTSLVHYYAMARYGSDINLDEFVPQAQGASAPDMYWIKCDAEDLPAIKQALEG